MPAEPSPTSAEFLEHARALRAEGAVRVSWGPFSVDYALSVAVHGEPERVAIDPLSQAERLELSELRELRQMAEELGNG